MEINLAAAALNQTPLDWQHNKNNIISVIHQAQQKGVNILCCPELSITGYGCEDQFLSSTTYEIAIEILLEIREETQNIAVAVGLPIFLKGALYNAIALLSNKRILGFAFKQHLAMDGIHYEARWFKPWQAGRQDQIIIDEKRYPCGDIIFELAGVRIGCEICEDAWIAERIAIELARRQVDIILNPSASHFSFDKYLQRKLIVENAAKAFKIGYVYANLLGNEAGRIIYDGDTYVAFGDKMLVEGKRFSFQDSVLTSASYNLNDLRKQRANLKIADQIEYYRTLSQKPIIKNNNTAKHEFAYAVTLGLYDYLRKSKAYGFVVNLSGGSDSAAVICLVYLMIKLGIFELGESGFYAKLDYIPQHYRENLLYSFYQSTVNSSLDTKNAARALSLSLEFPFADFNVDSIIKSYSDLIAPFIDTPLDWQNQDIALQNLQSRVRMPSIWLFANTRHAIVLCTSNRSESSVGYMTMDGDTAGGLSPIAGVNKSFIIEWLKWLKDEGLETPNIKVPMLLSILDQAPTAELRPHNMQQTDEADLMPYELLDAIEHCFVEKKLSPLKILKALQQRYLNRWSNQEIAENIDKFCKLWCRSQWKRERLAPCFHLDVESVDPKTWCRFPILSGEFEYELKQMWDLVREVKTMS